METHSTIQLQATASGTGAHRRRQQGCDSDDWLGPRPSAAARSGRLAADAASRRAPAASPGTRSPGRIAGAVGLLAVGALAGALGASALRGTNSCRGAQGFGGRGNGGLPGGPGELPGQWRRRGGRPAQTRDRLRGPRHAGRRHDHGRHQHRRSRSTPAARS